MFTVLVSISSPLTQAYYDSILHKIRIRALTCSCGKEDCLIYHGTYQRIIATEDKTVKLDITRVKCSYCRKTHAILLSTIVPYAKVSMPVQLETIHRLERKIGVEEILKKNPLIDKSTLTMIMLRYVNNWRERIRKLMNESGGYLCQDADWVISENLKECFPDLERKILEGEGCQFMQSRRAFNRLIELEEENKDNDG